MTRNEAELQRLGYYLRDNRTVPEFVKARGDAESYSLFRSGVPEEGVGEATFFGEKRWATKRAIRYLKTLTI